jgi:hypothetical protein
LVTVRHDVAKIIQDTSYNVYVLAKETKTNSWLVKVWKKTKRDSPARAGILEQSMGARNRVGIGLSHRPARLHRLAESIPWNRFLGSLKVKKYRHRLAYQHTREYK